MVTLTETALKCPFCNEDLYNYKPKDVMSPIVVACKKCMKGFTECQLALFCKPQLDGVGDK